MPRSARPTYSTVLKTRYWLRFAWRLLAVAIVLRNLWDERYSIRGVFNAITDPSQGGSLGDSIRTLLLAPVATLLIAGLMLLVERWVIRALVPDPFIGCARCGYPKGVSRGPCPECGEQE